MSLSISPHHQRRASASRISCSTGFSLQSRVTPAPVRRSFIRGVYSGADEITCRSVRRAVLSTSCPVPSGAEIHTSRIASNASGSIHVEWLLFRGRAYEIDILQTPHARRMMLGVTALAATTINYRLANTYKFGAAPGDREYFDYITFDPDSATPLLIARERSASRKCRHG